jgi:20S proteasome alpha/beta subunit
MDFFVGIKGKDFVMVCSDTSASHSIISIKQDEDKIVPIDDHKVFCIAGEAGDRVNFSEYVIANVKLYALRNGTELNTKSVANYTRGELATALRSVSSACSSRIMGGRQGGGRANVRESGCAGCPAPSRHLLSGALPASQSGVIPVVWGCIVYGSICGTDDAPRSHVGSSILT